MERQPIDILAGATEIMCALNEGVFIPADVSARFYPNHEHFGGTDRECHIMYIGEIVDAYVLG